MNNKEVVQKMLIEKGDGVLDSHTHAGFDITNIVTRRFPTVQSVSDLVRKFKSTGVNNTITFPCASDLFWFDSSLVARSRQWKYTGESAEDFPYQFANSSHLNEVELFGEGVVLPFINILPAVREEEQINSVLEEIKRGDIFGLKFHPLAVHTRADSLKQSRFIEVAQRYNLPVTIHSGPDKYSQAQQIVELAQTFPDVRFCIAHAAHFDVKIFTNRGCKLPNLFTDTSPFISLCYLANQEGCQDQILNLDYNDPARALVEFATRWPDNIIWGTDEPWTTLADKNKKILTKVSYEDECALLKRIPENLRRKISYENTMKYLFG